MPVRPASVEMTTSAALAIAISPPDHRTMCSSASGALSKTPSTFVDLSSWNSVGAPGRGLPWIRPDLGCRAEPTIPIGFYRPRIHMAQSGNRPRVRSTARFIEHVAVGAGMPIDDGVPTRPVAQWQGGRLICTKQRRGLGMVARRSLGRQFAWLWASCAVSTFGTYLGFGAFPPIAISGAPLRADRGVDAGRGWAGGGGGGRGVAAARPWVEFRRKRPVMIAMDPDPVCGADQRSRDVCARLAQLCPASGVVSIIVAAANICFTAASGACLEGAVASGTSASIVADARVRDPTTWTGHRTRTAARRNRDRAGLRSS